jgi:hypothetical protein
MYALSLYARAPGLDDLIAIFSDRLLTCLLALQTAAMHIDN